MYYGSKKLPDEFSGVSRLTKTPETLRLFDMGTRGRPKGSKNKKAFQNGTTAERHAKQLIATFGIDGAESVAQKTLEIIRANKARLDEKYKKT